MADGITFKSNSGEVSAKLKRLGPRGRRVVAPVVADSAFSIDRNTKKNLSRRGNVDRGRLVGSYHATKVKGTRGLTWSVETNVEYAPFVEHGTSPHTPPFDAILQWTRRKTGLSGKALRARAGANFGAIKKFGTKEHPHLFPAAVFERPRYVRNMRAALRSLERI